MGFGPMHRWKIAQGASLLGEHLLALGLRGQLHVDTTIAGQRGIHLQSAVAGGGGGPAALRTPHLDSLEELATRFALEHGDTGRVSAIFLLPRVTATEMFKLPCRTKSGAQ